MGNGGMNRIAVVWAVGLVAFATGACGGEPPSTMESAVAEPLTSTTCEQLALEVGDQLDAKLLEIADGPEDRYESRSVRISAWQIVIFQNLNTRLRELDIRDDCHTDEMLDMMETRFSDELVARAGDYLYDPVGDDPDETWTYEEWREAAHLDLGIIDGE